MFAGLAIFVPQYQRPRVVVTRRAIVGRQHQNRLEQQLSIVQDVAGHPDSGKNPHGFSVVAMLQEKCARDVLCGGQIAVREE